MRTLQRAAAVIALSAAPALAQTHQLIHSFQHAPAKPFASLTVGSDGNLYGVTSENGLVPGALIPSGGSIFVARRNLDGTHTFETLHHFGIFQGSQPMASLLEVTPGQFCGTTSRGGLGGAGTIYCFSEASGFVVLHRFEQQTHGADSRSGLTRGPDGSLYGMTSRGGPNGHGTIFRFSAVTGFSVVHAFTGFDGSGARGNLVLARDGNFYGTTMTGGFGFGTVFRMSPSGVVTLLRAFSPLVGIGLPTAGLMEAPDGRLWGTASGGADPFFGMPVAGGTFTVNLDGTVQTHVT